VISLLVYAIPYVLGVVMIAALLGAVTSFRRAQRAPYFRIRRDSSRAGWRWAAIFVVALAVTVGAIYARATLPPPDLQAILPAPLGPSSSQTPGPLVASSTPNLSLTPKNALEAPPSITPTQPTPSATPTLPIATIQSEVTPSPDASIRITDISSDISADLQPVNADTTFPVGLPRLYVWIEYASMADGVSWSRVLLLDGSVIRTESEEWVRGEEGSAYYYFDAQGGWPAGQYEIQFYIGDRLVESRTFSIVD
jgi:hypothetical protein